MIARSTISFLILVVVKTCSANRRPIILTQPPNISWSPDSSAKYANNRSSSKGRIHISEFTDPDTGVNPFVDIKEGQTGAFGRQTLEKIWPFPIPRTMQADHESNMMEGSAEDNGHTRPRTIQSNPRWPHKTWHVNRSQNTNVQKPSNNNRKVPMVSAKEFLEKTRNNVDDVFTDEPSLTSDDYTTFSLMTDNGATTSSPINDISSVESKEEKSATSSLMITLITSAVGIFLVGLVVLFVLCWKRRKRDVRDITRCAEDVESQKKKKNRSIKLIC